MCSRCQNLEKYKGLTIEKHEHALEEDRVEKELQQVRNKRARFEVVERPAKMGDVAIIDFVGMVMCDEFDGGKPKAWRTPFRIRFKNLHW